MRAVGTRSTRWARLAARPRAQAAVWCRRSACKRGGTRRRVRPNAAPGVECRVKPSGAWRRAFRCLPPRCLLPASAAAYRFLYPYFSAPASRPALRCFLLPADGAIPRHVIPSPASVAAALSPLPSRHLSVLLPLLPPALAPLPPATALAPPASHPGPAPLPPPAPLRSHSLAPCPRCPASNPLAPSPLPSFLPRSIHGVSFLPASVGLMAQTTCCEYFRRPPSVILAADLGKAAGKKRADSAG